MTGITELLPIQQVSLFGNDQHRLELIRFDFLKGDPYAELQGSHEIQRTADQKALLRRLGGVEPVQRAVATPVLIVRSIRAEAGIAQFLAAHRPMHQEPVRRIIRPLPG